MKKQKSIFKIMAFSIFIFFMGSSLVFAVNPDGYICSHNYHTFGDKEMTGGVGNYGSNRRYWNAVSF